MTMKNGATPREEAYSIVMTMISNAIKEIDIDENQASWWYGYGGEHSITPAQAKKVADQLAKLHNRLGKQARTLDYMDIER